MLHLYSVKHYLIWHTSYYSPLRKSRRVNILSTQNQELDAIHTLFLEPLATEIEANLDAIPLC